MLGVDVLELVVVEGGRAAVDLLQREFLDQRRPVEDLVAAGADRPAEQGQVVDHRVGQDAEILELLDAGRAVPLAEALAVGAEDHRQVPELRRLPAERPEDQQLERRVADVVVAAQHVADLHGVVVHHHGEVVGRKAIGLHDDAVAEDRVLELALADHQVIPVGGALARHAQPPAARLARRHAPPRLGRVEVAAAAVVAVPHAAGFLDGRGPLFQFVGRAEARIDGARVAQRRQDVQIDRQALALQIGSVGAALAWPFVPVQTQPLHGPQDRGVARFAAALLVGVLDAQDERAALVARIEPVEERGAGAADVQVARGARREADADVRRIRHGCCCLSDEPAGRTCGARGCTAVPRGSGRPVASTAAASSAQVMP